MEIFGQVFNIGNSLGYYSFLSLILLIIMYLIKPKPFKKVIPSIIFLESNKKRNNLRSFFNKFAKDWIMLLQFLIVLLLCLSILDISTEYFFKKIDKEVVFVIDASASSKARHEGRMLFDHYIREAKRNIGVSNSIILVKENPEVIAKQTNPVNAHRILSGAEPTDSLSNIWDAMMLAPDLSQEKTTIIVLSDLIDTNNKDLRTARRLLRAKGYEVEFVSMKTSLSNVGITDVEFKENSVILSVKNFDNMSRNVEFHGERVRLSPYSVEQFDFELQEGVNIYEIDTEDDFDVDDSVTIIKPEEAGNNVLYITNRNSYARSAFESIDFLNLKIARPPIVNLGNEELIIMDNFDYDSLLPGTVDNIRQKVEGGTGLMILAQEKDFKADKLGELIPVNILKEKNEIVEVKNTGNIEEVAQTDFDLSRKYYSSELKDNRSVVAAYASDTIESPVIVLSRIGSGNILYYGILDNYSPFKTTTRYPLFWVNMVQKVLEKRNTNRVNKPVSSILYGEDIRGPEGRRYSDYVITEHTGIYTVDGNEFAVNLVNLRESNINQNFDIENKDDEDISRTRNTFNLLPLFLVLILIISFLELYALKRRGEL